MKQASYCLVAVVAVLISACATGGRPAPAPVEGARAPSVVRVKMGPRGAVRAIPLEEYVRGTVISEMAPAPGEPAAEAMLDVQAIIARTFAVSHLSRHGRDGYDLCPTTHCQLYDPARLKTSRWAGAAAEAGRRTSGVVLWYGAAPASTLFHADCGGHTSTATEVWGGAAGPYLAAARDDGPADAAHTAWRFEVEERDLLAALNRDARTRIGRRLSGMSVLERDAGGRAARIRITGTRDAVVRGEHLRAVLGQTFGARAVRSTRFDIRRTGTGYVFTGRGFGHGVGLCQAGALARLRTGAKPAEVLARYYPGTRLVTLR